MTIVCGTDFSTPGGAAAHVAARLAAKLGDKLVLASVHPAMEDSASVVVACLAREVQALSSVTPKVESHALTGDPARMLADQAKKDGARLLVIGAAERAGRVPDRTAAVSEVPTLVVRNRVPLEAWLDGKRTLKVVLAAAPDHSHGSARELVVLLRSLGPVDVVVGQVSYPAEDRHRMGLTHGTGSAVVNDQETERVLVAELTRNIGTLPGQGDLRFVIKPTLEHVDDALVDLANDEGADLLVVGSHQRAGLSRLWFGSVAEGLVRHARTNVCVVPHSSLQEPLPRVDSVLVPIDGTHACARSVALACSLAGPRGVVHLVQVTAKADGADAAIAAARALVPAGALAQGTRLEVHVVQGKDVAEALCAASLRLGCDLVCMRAARSKNAAAPLLLGSVTNDVLARSTRPVTIVRDS